MKNFKLYHISLYPIKDNLFIPRIPQTRIMCEDDTIPRICFSTSVGGCISAIPGGINSMKVLLKCDYIEGLYLYEIDSSQINPKNIKTPIQLVNEELVPDALWTDECWIINQEVQCMKPKLIKLTNIESTMGSIDNQKSVEWATSVQYDILTDNYMVLEKYIWTDECFSAITKLCNDNNISYKYEKVDKGYVIIINDFEVISYEIWSLLIEDFWISLNNDCKKDLRKTYTRYQTLQVIAESYEK